MKNLVFATAALAAASVASTAWGQTAEADWTGAYVGAQAGWGWQKNQGDETVVFDTNRDGTYGDTVTTAAGADAFAPGFCGGRAAGATPAQGCAQDKNDGFEFGGRAGYDRQFGNFVVGALGEFTRTDVDDSVSAFSSTPAAYTFKRSLKNVAAARARAGYAFDRNLVYATGGYASGRIKNRFATTNTANTFVVDDGDKRSDGWQLGGGVERKVTPKVSLGVEYLYTKLDDDGATVTAQGPAPAGNPFLTANAVGTDLRRSDDDFKTQSVRVTANYRF